MDRGRGLSVLVLSRLAVSRFLLPIRKVGLNGDFAETRYGSRLGTGPLDRRSTGRAGEQGELFKCERTGAA